VIFQWLESLVHELHFHGRGAGDRPVAGLLVAAAIDAETRQAALS